MVLKVPQASVGIPASVRNRLKEKAKFRHATMAELVRRLADEDILETHYQLLAVRRQIRQILRELKAQRNENGA